MNSTTKRLLYLSGENQLVYLLAINTLKPFVVIRSVAGSAFDIGMNCFPLFRSRCGSAHTYIKAALDDVIDEIAKRKEKMDFGEAINNLG